MHESNDLVTKNFEAYPDVAADIVNALIHEGREEVGAGQLLAASTESLYQHVDGSLHDQLEDVAQYHMDEKKPIALYLLANQTAPDKRMLLRKAGYEGGAYRRQYEGQGGGVFPVMELVLYWGERAWTGERSLRELTAGSSLAPATWNYVDDLKLHVWEMRRLPVEVRNRFRSDMRIIVDYLAEGDSYRSDRKIIHKEATIKMLRVLAGDNNVEETTKKLLEDMNVTEEDEITVCELFDQYWRRGREEGWLKGRNEGRAEGILAGKGEERLEGIRSLVITCKELGADYEQTADKVRLRYELPEEEVQKDMALYW